MDIPSRKMLKVSSWQTATANDHPTATDSVATLLEGGLASSQSPEGVACLSGTSLVGFGSPAFQRAILSKADWTLLTATLYSVVSGLKVCCSQLSFS
jgi:hypothetical protein